MKKICVVLLTVMMIVGAASAERLYMPGTYEGTAPGYHGTIHVSVEVDEDTILAVTVGENEETYHVGEKAFPILSESIVSNQSLADVVTGATISSRAMTNAVVKALENANASSETISALKAVPLKIENPGDTETDVVVVGAGVAGMMAASHAVDNGARVILLEKNSLVGGSALISAGAMLSVGDEAITDTTFTAEDVYRWYNIQSGPVLNDDVFYEIMNNTKFAVEYLKKNGTEFGDPGMNQAKLAPIFRSIGGLHFGTSLIDGMESILADRAVDLRTNTFAVGLIYDDDGKIAGVTAQNGAGTYAISAKKVILATGGFAFNSELMEQYAAEYTGDFIITTSGATGDGHKMGMEAGGHLIGDGVLQIYCTSYDPSLDGNQPGFIPLMVDSTGNQMCALDEYYGTVTTKIMNLPDRKAYAIYSSDNIYVQFDYPNGGFKLVDMDALVESGKLVKADTLEELAEKIGIDPASLIRSVEEHNWYYDLQINDAWGTDASVLQPMKLGPYYAAREVACVMGTIAGLEINTDMQVVDEEGDAIENLYAVGELIFGNVFNKRYPMSGTAIGIASTSGMLAGIHAAESLK